VVCIRVASQLSAKKKSFSIASMNFLVLLARFQFCSGNLNNCTVRVNRWKQREREVFSFCVAGDQRGNSIATSMRCFHLLRVWCQFSGRFRFQTTALMDLYIHPLYILISKILSSILNSPAPIHPLYYPLSTLSTLGPTYHFI
jgi:hypothetical protein